jgi:hypothetical protein
MEGESKGISETSCSRHVDRGGMRSTSLKKFWSKGKQEAFNLQHMVMAEYFAVALKEARWKPVDV